MLGLLRVNWIAAPASSETLDPRLAGGHPVNGVRAWHRVRLRLDAVHRPRPRAILPVASAVQTSLQEASACSWRMNSVLQRSFFLLAALFMRELLERTRALRGSGRSLQFAAGIVMILFVLRWRQRRGTTFCTGCWRSFRYWAGSVDATLAAGVAGTSIPMRHRRVDSPRPLRIDNRTALPASRTGCAVAQARPRRVKDVE